MKITKKTTITIGICAFNAEQNIGRLLNSLSRQRMSAYQVDKIIVISDASSDKTDMIVKANMNSKIKLYSNKLRKGFAGNFKKCIDLNTSDVIILLNDDIIIDDINFLEKIAFYFNNEEKIGLICGSATSLPPKNFIERAVGVGYNAFKNMGIEYREGNNIFSVDGKCLALSEKLAKKIYFPQNLARLGNVDKYIYLSCVKNGLRYKFLHDVKYYFKYPSTINDFTKWQIRNYGHTRLKREFGSLYTKEVLIPKNFMYYKIIEFIKDPIAATFILLVGIYCLVTSKLVNKKLETTWDPVSTTKNLKSYG